MPESIETEELNTDAVAPLRADPDHSAVLFDLDGTLAPIVARPEDAEIAARSRAALRLIAERYALTAIVTGRRALVARGIVKIDTITYAGNHGFELLAPGAEEAEPAPAVRERARDAPAFLARQDLLALEAAGIRTEDKGPIVALHWRGAPDPAAAEVLVAQVAAEAEQVGLITHRGRLVVELRPSVAIDKGVAVDGLLAGAEVRVALYAGDDRTDLDAFAALARLRDSSDLRQIVRVGVRSAEGPDEIVTGADLVVEGPEALPPLLEALAG